MAITGSTDIGNGLFVITVDHDPAVVATNAPAGAVIIDSSGSWYRKLDSGSTVNVSGQQLRKDNLTASSAPGVNDDNTQFYQVGSAWVNLTSDQKFVCVDASTGAAIWSAIRPGAGAITQFFATNGNDTRGTYATVVIASNANVDITFFAPNDLVDFGTAEVVLMPVATNTLRDIDIIVNYATVGEDLALNVGSNTTATYDLIADQIKSIDITSLLGSIKAGDFVGVNIDHNSVGQNIDYLGVLITYT